MARLNTTVRFSTTLVRVLRGRVLPSHHIIVTGSSIDFSYHYFGGKISL